MKTFRKVIAVVVAMVCCFTMINPLSVKATVIPGGEIPLCNHELTSETLLNEYSYDCEITTHDFYMYYHNGEEWIEDASFECEIKKIYQEYERSCACGERTEYVTRTMVQHLNPDCPNY